MTRKILYTPLLIIILFAAGMMVLVKGCLSKYNTYGVVDKPAMSEDSKLIVVLVAESEATSRQVNGGYRSTSYTSSYWLKQYETVTGKLLKKKKLISAAEKQNMLPLCYGIYQNTVWLHTNGLKAYSISTLEEVVNETQLAANNGFDKNNFPDDQRFIDAAVAEGYISFTAQSGDKYRLNLQDLKITPEKETGKTGEDAADEVARWPDAQDVSLGARCDTLNNKMFILAKDSAAAINSYPGNGNDEPVYSKMKMFTADYIVSSLGRHKLYRYNKLRQLNGDTYLNPVFLKDISAGKTVHLQRPGSFVILHNDNISNDAKSFLTAVDENNNRIWQLNTGLSTRLAYCTVKNNYCILIGNRHAILAPHMGSDDVCVINIETGKMENLSIKD